MSWNDEQAHGERVQRSWVNRADRPSRARAIAALVAYLEEHRDIRIGQAIVNASGAVDAFNIEDDELASTLEQATRRRPGHR